MRTEDDAAEPSPGEGWTRREMMHLAARAVALPGAASFFAAWLQAAPHQQGARMATAPPEGPLLREYVPRFFEREDFEALEAFTAILIPTDDTPGAREARCAHFIDFVLDASRGVADDTVATWRRALTALRDAGFHAADADGRAGMVAEMSRPERDAGARHPAYAAYRLIKSETAFAFYTSRAGIIEALDYRGNSYNASFPGCTHPEHQRI